MAKDLWIIDWKSSKDIYEEYRIQLATYGFTQYALEPHLPLPKLGVLRLDKETGIPHFEDVSEGMEERFKAFLGLYEYYRNSNKKEPKKGYDKNGIMVPSVTTILACLDKSGPLMYWAVDSTIELIKQNLPEIRNPDTTDNRLDQIFKKARAEFRSVGKKAMDTGTTVHDAIECYLSGGKPEEYLDGNDKATNAFLAFLEWKDAVKLEPISLEKKLIHPIYDFGGSCDFLGYAEI